MAFIVRIRPTIITPKPNKPPSAPATTGYPVVIVATALPRASPAPDTAAINPSGRGFIGRTRTSRPASSKRAASA